MTTWTQEVVKRRYRRLASHGEIFSPGEPDRQHSNATIENPSMVNPKPQ
jgi:hypothetical protein